MGRSCEGGECTQLVQGHAPGRLATSLARGQIPAHSFGKAALYLLFWFLLAFAFFLLTVSNQIGTNGAWEDQLEPLHNSCLSNSRGSVSCLVVF